MRVLICSALVAVTCLLPAVPARADVTVTISDGYVSVEAKDATVRQILSEWSRVGQTRIVNAERIAGAPLSLHLIKVPEAQALDILLRSVSGYMAAPRAVPLPNASQFDRILVMPTSAPPRPAPTQAASQPPPFQQPVTPAVEDFQDDQAPGAPPQQRGPIFPQYPNPANGQPPAGGLPTRGPVFPPAGLPQNQAVTPAPQGGAPNQAFPPNPAGAPARGAMPVGVATPGMVVQPAQPGNPPEPPQ